MKQMAEEKIHSVGQAVLRQVAGQYVLIPIGETAMKIQKLICLTESSVMLWNMVTEGTTEEKLQQALLDTYEVDPETARTDTQAFLRSMRELGLI